MSRVRTGKPRKNSNFFVCSDASGTGCGAFLYRKGELVRHKLWEENKHLKISFWGDLVAIEFALEAFLPLILDSYVQWLTDSQTTCSIIQVG